VTVRRPGRRPTASDSGDRGVVAVEFALVIPILLVVLFTIVAAGSMYFDQLHLQQVARDAARVAAIEPTAACATATGELTGNTLGTVTCNLVRTCGTNPTDTTQVRLQSVQTLSLPLIGDRTVTLTASSTFICPP
jgi:Flp pilus assembly protein TadG